MKFTITRILRITPHLYRVHLECGHHRTVAAAVLEKEQLYIGRRVTCPVCQELHTKGKIEA